MQAMLMTMADAQRVATASVPYPRGVMARRESSAVSLKMAFINNRFLVIKIFKHNMCLILNCFYHLDGGYGALSTPLLIG